MILPWRMLTVTSLEKKEGEIPSYPLAPNPGRIFFSLLLFLMLLTPVWGQELPDAPQPQLSGCQQIQFEAAKSGAYLAFTCGPSGEVIAKKPLLKRHSWFYRHPILTGSIIGGGIALGWGLTHRDSCPSMVTGYPYNGYGHPCPTRCDSDGCYWGPIKR